MSPSRAPVFSCGHYFQAPATQATGLSSKLFETFNWILMRSGENYFDKKIDKLS